MEPLRHRFFASSSDSRGGQALHQTHFPPQQTGHPEQLLTRCLELRTWPGFPIITSQAMSNNCASSKNVTKRPKSPNLCKKNCLKEKKKTLLELLRNTRVGVCKCVAPPLKGFGSGQYKGTRAHSWALVRDVMYTTSTSIYTDAGVSAGNWMFFLQKFN